MTHTPTPWAWERGYETAAPTVFWAGSDDIDIRIVRKDARRYDDHASAEEDAAFFVRACNSHDALVSALEETRNVVSLVPAFSVSPDEHNWVEDLRRKIDAALALAKGDAS